MRLSRICSVICASHSRVSFLTSATSFLTLATQWRWLSSTWSTDATPSIHWGKLSNRDHWSYAVVTSTFTSIDCSTEDMEYQLLPYSGIRERSRCGARRTQGTGPGLAVIQTWSSSAPAGTPAAKPAARAAAAGVRVPLRGRERCRRERWLGPFGRRCESERRVAVAQPQGIAVFV